MDKQPYAALRSTPQRNTLKAILVEGISDGIATDACGTCGFLQREECARCHKRLRFLSAKIISASHAAVLVEQLERNADDKLRIADELWELHLRFPQALSADQLAKIRVAIG